MHSIKKLAASALTLLLLAACGGGGGVSSNNASTVPPVTPNTTSDSVISGMASKAPINGTVAIYAITADGSKGALLNKDGKLITITKGNYTVNIGKYDVPVIIEVSGSYTDEATGAVIPLDKPLRAALASSAAATKIAVTPLTELAVQKAEQKTGALSSSNIIMGNKLVSDIFKFDIITTQPVAPTDAAAIAAAEQNRKDYTLALAAISQLSNTQGVPLAATLANLAENISPSGMTSQTVSNFQKAANDFISSGNNQTGITDIAATSLAKFNGGSIARFTLALQGSFAANAINGITLEVVIPPGLTVRYDATSKLTLPGIVSLSPAAAAADATLMSWYSQSDGVLHLGVTSSSKGFGAGDLVTITCDVVPGWPKPAATAFIIRNVSAAGGTTTINGVTVTVK
jgi:hypothetical protein